MLELWAWIRLLKKSPKSKWRLFISSINAAWPELLQVLVHNLNGVVSRSNCTWFYKSLYPQPYSSILLWSLTPLPFPSSTTLCCHSNPNLLFLLDIFTSALEAMSSLKPALTPFISSLNFSLSFLLLNKLFNPLNKLLDIWSKCSSCMNWDRILLAGIEVFTCTNASKCRLWGSEFWAQIILCMEGNVLMIFGFKCWDREESLMTKN